MKEVLFIHSVCCTGGIETFFIRLSRELREKNTLAKFIFLYKNETEKHIEDQLKKYAEIYYWEDISSSPSIKSDKLKLLFPLKAKTIKAHFSSIECIHVDTALTFFSAKRIISCLGQNIKLVFGVYHANELAWSFDGRIPRFEEFFRKKLFLKTELILFFNDFSKEITCKKNSIDLQNVMVFPLGIDFPREKSAVQNFDNKIRIISIGRLVSFKSYNIYMPDLIWSLRDIGMEVTYHVYGDGPLYFQLSEDKKLKKNPGIIQYRGTLEYSKIDTVLKNYDLFIGSGTALLQAAANGIPSIIAIENEINPISYGFFSDIPGIDYHEQDLPYPRYDIFEIIINFSKKTTAERYECSEKHIQKSSIFSIEICVENFLKAFELAKVCKGSSFNFYYFIALFTMSEISSKLLGKPRYSSKYDQVLK